MSVLAMQIWPWDCYWRGQRSTVGANLEESMVWSRVAGFEAWEGNLPGLGEDTRGLRLALDRSGLVVESLYANARLHGPDAAAQVTELLRRCSEAAALGLKVLVVNPEPVNWATAQEKTDFELQRQKDALRSLSRSLRAQGQTMAYHVHSSEMRSGGRELLAMCAGTDFGLCLELEWMIRGGWSAERALEFTRAHVHRVTAAHCRQQKDGKFQLEFGAGDIDYAAAWVFLKQAGFHGPVAFEGYRETACSETEMRAALKASATAMQTLASAP